MTAIIISFLAMHVMLAFGGLLSAYASVALTKVAQFDLYARHGWPSPRAGLDRALLSPASTFACA